MLSTSGKTAIQNIRTEKCITQLRGRCKYKVSDTNHYRLIFVDNYQLMLRRYKLLQANMATANLEVRFYMLLKKG